MPLALLLALSLAPSPSVVSDSVRYAVSFPDPAHHEARIVADFPAAGRDTLEIWISRSSPGRYAIHEFAKNVYDVRVTDAAGKPLTVVRHDPYRWLVVARGRAVRFAYTLYGDRADGTYSQIDAGHAHLNMPATFAWARGLEARPIAVRFTPPDGSNWRVATQLVQGKDSLSWRAPDLAYFMDSPAELSDFTLRSWPVPGKGRTDTIRLALHHQGSDAEADAFAEAVGKVVAEQVGIFGETALYDHHVYTFLSDYLPWASGDGMEHRNSTVLSAPATLAQSFNQLLLPVSHEFFHSWNMERIRSAELEPFDFTKADPSDALWFGEGFTNYFDRLSVRRAGLSSDSAFAGQLASIVNSVVLSPGRRFHSPMEMSLLAPFVDAATAIDPTNLPNTFLSYYTWGSGDSTGPRPHAARPSRRQDARRLHAPHVAAVRAAHAALRHPTTLHSGRSAAHAGPIHRRRRLRQRLLQALRAGPRGARLRGAAGAGGDAGRPCQTQCRLRRPARPGGRQHGDHGGLTGHRRHATLRGGRGARRPTGVGRRPPGRRRRGVAGDAGVACPW